MLHFGTDGVRGVAIDELTTELARDLARATARVLRPVAIVIGRDTRESGSELEDAIVPLVFCAQLRLLLVATRVKVDLN